MSTNVSKKKREDLLSKIGQIRTFIASAPQDTNTGNLLSYLSELEKDINGKKYGLIFEEHKEHIDEVLESNTPVLNEDKDLFINNGEIINFLIEGDNLASLQMLEKTHRGKVDLIYIDPPYNTLKDGFTYSDTLVDKNDTFRHSKWLSFMRRRLVIAQKLLSSNGTIFISIDDNEVAALNMEITLANFQLKAIFDLMEAMEGLHNEIVLKSCTGSGKTIILTHFIDEYIKSNSRTVFIWLTPGKGGLEEQSKNKMDKYIHGSHTKLLHDIMASGFEENDVCFINWEKLTKKGNTALRDSERTNFVEYIKNALDAGLSFKVIVDESHQNDTIKADDIIELFHPDKIIRCSATPKGYKNATVIDIPEEDVISEGLIKKLLVINENFEQNISVDDQISYLIQKAIAKQQEIHAEFLRRNVNVNPLIVVQIPNKSDALLDRIEEYFESQGITYENSQLAVWLSDKKQNLEGISDPDATPIAVIIKQAVATGWDCPRAHILVKLRDNMSETFEIQTIGRIRRMPEAKHYDCDLLDCCYLFTLDEKFTESVKLSLGKDALEAYRVFLKSEHRSFTLISEYKTNVPFPRDAKLALKVISKFFEKKYHATSDMDKNKTLLEAHGYSFAEDIIDYTKSGEVSILSKENISGLNDVAIHEPLNTHKHGKAYHHCVAEIGFKINLDYSSINAIIRKLFLQGLHCDCKILKIDTRALYAFVINNKHRLIEDVRSAMSDEALQLSLDIPKVTEKPIGFPQETLFTYDITGKSQSEMTKNVYKRYLASAERRSLPEKLFERHCQNSSKVSWFYKNGDKGIEYFSIVYVDNFGKQKSFYPDYVVGATDGSVWIIETKGALQSLEIVKTLINTRLKNLAY